MLSQRSEKGKSLLVWKFPDEQSNQKKVGPGGPLNFKFHSSSFGSIWLCWCGCWLSKLIYLQSLSAPFRPAFKGACKKVFHLGRPGKYIAKKSHKRQDFYLNASFNFYRSLLYLPNPTDSECKRSNNNQNDENNWMVMVTRQHCIGELERSENRDWGQSRTLPTNLDPG